MITKEHQGDHQETVRPGAQPKVGRGCFDLPGMRQALFWSLCLTTDSKQLSAALDLLTTGICHVKSHVSKKQGLLHHFEPLYLLQPAQWLLRLMAKEV